MKRKIIDIRKALKQKRAELTARGYMSDPGRTDVQLLGYAENLAAITQQQQREIHKLEKQLKKREVYGDIHEMP